MHEADYQIDSSVASSNLLQLGRQRKDLAAGILEVLQC